MQVQGVAHANPLLSPRPAVPGVVLVRNGFVWPGRWTEFRPQVRRPVFQRIFWDLGPGHKPDISLEKYKAVIKLLVAATVGCQGAKN